ncbi:MAG: hypothetical protein M3O31_18155 [Acidobacteriota bacterium]|nr:hypothetical protein [Acidobacteriota bacterium]
MKPVIRSLVVLLCLILQVNQFPSVAQTPNPPSSNAPGHTGLDPRAPVPAQIAAAHTVFLSNAGTDTSFPIDATQAYNDVYKALQTWGRYQLVASPDKADLIFQLRGVSTLSTYGSDDSVYTVNSPAFQLTMVDPKSSVTLWTITSPVALAGSKQTLARWVAIAETNLVSRIKVVAGDQLGSSETADLTTVPNFHHGRAALIIVGGTVALAVGGGLLLHHFYENSLADQKASQDAFCTAHQIPLSMCAGG